MLIDSHCHLDRLDLSLYQGDLSLALQAANMLDVHRFLCVCIDLENFSAVKNIAEQHPTVWATLGIHPTEPFINEPSIAALVELANHPKIIGIGETGLDYYHFQDNIPAQQQRFRNHIQAAKILKKPLIIHSRLAPADTITILKQEKADAVGGILHCFTENWEMAQAAIDLGFYISFSGIITFPNAKTLRTVAQKVPLSHLLIETDAPYLAPVPHRGKPNQPAYVRYTADALAQLKAVDLNTIATHTTANFQRLFSHLLQLEKLETP